MAQYSYTPSAGEVGSAPAGFTYFGDWGAAGAAATVVNAGDGRHAIAFTSTNDFNGFGLTWDGAGAAPASADIEIYARIRHRDANKAGDFGIAVRASGAGTGSYSAYAVRNRIFTDNWGNYRIQEFNSGSLAAENGDASLPNSVNDDLHIILRANAGNISYAWWRNTPDTEPGLSTFADATLSSASRAIISFGRAADAYMYFVGVGTAGDAAPRGGAPGGGGSASLPLTGGLLHGILTKGRLVA